MLNGDRSFLTVKSPPKEHTHTHTHTRVVWDSFAVYRCSLGLGACTHTVTACAASEHTHTHGSPGNHGKRKPVPAPLFSVPALGAATTGTGGQQDVCVCVCGCGCGCERIYLLSCTQLHKFTSVCVCVNQRPNCKHQYTKALIICYCYLLFFCQFLIL